MLLKGREVQISRFRQFLGRPLVNGDVGRDWQALEARSGVTFPADYKQFVTAYGPGCVNDQLYVFHPKAAGGSEGLRLESLWEQASYAHSELSRNAPDYYPYPIYPTPGGCIPVARSTSGNQVLLAPPKSGESDWSVVLDMGQWIPVAMSFTDFLWSALCEELHVPVLDGEPSFQPVGTVEP
ncbi:SMI1/KNR4 family protein [Streptomyces sp. HUAS ZL42]|uniref:SMI1/KNR4 family protein n=1 Tax=Streptomyces sp. HUAS ZL42 TaxID=3231715 RepID=UPI00345EFC28